MQGNGFNREAGLVCNLEELPLAFNNRPDLTLSLVVQRSFFKLIKSGHDKKQLKQI